MAKDLTKNPVELLVIGGSAGSLEVIIKAFPDLPDTLPFAIIIVLHRKQNTDNALVDLLAAKTKHPVIEAHEKETLKKGDFSLIFMQLNCCCRNNISFRLSNRHE
jgi:two-component system chemotaxis response regulator CheB